MHSSGDGHVLRKTPWTPSKAMVMRHSPDRKDFGGELDALGRSEPGWLAPRVLMVASHSRAGGEYLCLPILIASRVAALLRSERE